MKIMDCNRTSMFKDFKCLIRSSHNDRNIKYLNLESYFLKEWFTMFFNIKFSWKVLFRIWSSSNTSLKFVKKFLHQTGPS